MKTIIPLILLVYSIAVFSKTHQPQKFLHSISGSNNEGEQIYQHFCSNCHAKKPLIMLGAPRIGDKKDWKHRVKQGFDVLFTHTDIGFNAMPPRGGCFECTDRQLALTIITMIPKESRRRLLNDLLVNKKYTK